MFARYLPGNTEMTKDLLSEQDLLDVINEGLAKNWPHKDFHCLVGKLKEANLPDRNWELDTTNTGGPSLEHFEECDELRQIILNKLAARYDVRWLR